MDLLSNKLGQNSIERSSKRRRRRRKNKRRNKRIPRIISSLLLLSVIVGSSTFGYAAWRFEKALNHILSVPDSPTEKTLGSPVATEEPEATKPFSILIMGRDSRPETGTNLTDVMMVAAVNPGEKKGSMVSIPRDTKMMVPEAGRELKLNRILNVGDQLEEEEGHTADSNGPALAKKVIGRLFDIPIDHYIIVDFNSFVEIVDQVGGITVNVERDLVYNDPTDDTHIDLHAGVQQLDGKHALDWIRHRHDDRGTDYYSSDFDRNRRQKEAIQAIAQELAGWKGAASALDLMDTMAEHIQTDLTKDQIKDLLWSFKSFDPNLLKSIETPHVYWDSHRLQTVIPEEDLSSVHNELGIVLNKMR